ncbi:MAG TPA: bifunctional ornithine acetyltransferase/N-acetylglutamate synthase, partial [Myxococcota bacterium]
MHCGIKPAAPDLALLFSDRPAAVAGVFTRSTVVGAPVELSRARVRSGRARAVVINSGVSNVAMGARGLRDARAMADEVGRILGVAPGQVLVASTGVIGAPLPMPRVRRGIRAASAALTGDGLARAAQAIMTTDTFPKLARATARVGGRTISVAGIAKGSGMIEPNMATMLAFILTDADVAPAFLRGVLRGVADESFNRVSVDGEGSTSDMLLLLANGAAGNPTLRSARSAGA